MRMLKRERSAGQAHDEHALMAAFARREEEALEQLFERFGGLAYGIGIRLFGEDRAPEFVERTFVRLWRRAPEYRWSPQPLETWVTSHALRVSVEMRRERTTDDDGRRTSHGTEPVRIGAPACA
jgi:DNA-directed RNA polymerase specialized sigma24 family protein